MKILFSANASWNLLNFRGGFIRALLKDGHEVVCVAPVDGATAKLTELGCRHVPVTMDNKGTSPRADYGLYRQYLEILKAEKPDVYLGFTIKPNIYGSIAAHRCGVPVINNVSGLGTAFIRVNWLTRVVKLLYRHAFRKSVKVFFQNDDDRKLFLGNRLVEQARTGLLPGSGIDLDRFPVSSKARNSGKPVFLLIARLLWDKGVGEYVEAARIVKESHPGARFQLLGFLDVENRTAVPRADVEGWVAEGVCEYLGTTDDVRPFIAAADCVVLPSYREGTPRTLLEAAAMAKPLVATDVPGCREVVDDGVNGFLCEVRNGPSLAEACLRLLALDDAKLKKMGASSRHLAETRFDEKLVIDAYREAISDATGRLI